MSKILPKRKSPRAQWIEYNAGLYFITICTHNWVHYFGEIKFGKIYLTELGEDLNNNVCKMPRQFNGKRILLTNYVGTTGFQVCKVEL